VAGEKLKKAEENSDFCLLIERFRESGQNGKEGESTETYTDEGPR